MMFKRAKVVMLPTNEKANALWWSGHKLYVKSPEDSTRGKLNHLYILSDEEIKEGDWRMMIDKSSILYGQFEKHLGKHECNDQWKKIIATTDKSLYPQCDGKCAKKECVCIFPQPSQSFIEKYIDEYNKGNQIKEVMVEYEAMNTTIVNRTYNEFEPKINPRDNTITIRKVKDSWNREEVIDLLQNCWSDSAFNLVKQTNNEEFMTFNKWIEENL